MKRKIRRLLLTSILAIPFSASLTSVALSEMVYISYIRVAPYVYGESATMNIAFTRYNDGPLQVTVFTKRNETSSYIQALSRSAGNSAGSVTTSLTIPANRLYQNSTIVSVMIPASNVFTGEAKTVTFTLYERKGETINVGSDANKTVSIDNIVSYSDSKKSSYYIAETFDFSSLENIILEDYYYRIDISNISFTYEYSLTSNVLDDFNASLYIYDEGYYFPYLGEDYGSYRKLDLTFVKEDGTNVYKVSNSNIFYVDPSTFITYNEHQEGLTLPTQFIYLPKAKYNGDFSLNFALYLENMGVNRNTYVYNFTHIANNGLLGSCVGAKYCVVGENSNPSFVYGTLYEESK